MAVNIELPQDLEQRLRAEFGDLDKEAREALALALFRRQKVSHFELSKLLNLDRLATNAFLKRHNVTEGSLTMQDLEEQARTLDKVLGPVHN